MYPIFRNYHHRINVVQTQLFYCSRHTHNGDKKKKTLLCLEIKIMYTNAVHRVNFHWIHRDWRFYRNNFLKRIIYGESFFRDYISIVLQKINSTRSMEKYTYHHFVHISITCVLHSASTWICEYIIIHKRQNRNV